MTASHRAARVETLLWTAQRASAAVLAICVAVALVLDQGPGAVERRRAQVLRIPRHHVARGVAHGAADALDAGIRLHARRRVRPHFREVVLARGVAAEFAFGARPLVEKLAHVGHQVANDRQVA